MSQVLKDDFYTLQKGYYDYGCNYDYEEIYNNMNKEKEDEDNEQSAYLAKGIKMQRNEVIL